MYTDVDLATATCSSPPPPPDSGSRASRSSSSAHPRLSCVWRLRQGTTTTRLLWCVVLFATWTHRHAVHAQFVRHLCKNDIDLLADEGVYVEKFERSHIELALADHKRAKRYEDKTATIRFEFRTKDPNGLLFYGRREEEPSELLAMNLWRGYLYYTVRCSTVKAHVMVPHLNRLNDSVWHSVLVRFRRGGNTVRTHVEVDGVRDTKTYEVSCGQLTSLVFGGVKPQDKRLLGHLGHLEHYEGCIRRVNIPYGLRTPPKYYAISVCETSPGDRVAHQHSPRQEEHEPNQ